MDETTPTLETAPPLVEVLPAIEPPPARNVVIDSSGFKRDLATGQIMAKPPGYPKSGGRTKGTKNKASNGIRKFALNMLMDREYRRELRKKLKDHSIDPGIHRMLYQYAYGRPPETIELTGKDGGPIKVDQEVRFYIPKNGRDD